MNLIQSSFAYNGHDFSVVENETAVMVAGNAVMLWNTKTLKKDYIWSKRNGYCMASSNYNSGLVACAEYGLNPEMHIYKVPGKELKHKFAMDTTVKCIALAFSRCSKYLLMIGGVPDFHISIFDLENNKKLVIPETKLPCKPEEFIQAKFNPQSKSQFAILSQTCFYNYNIHQAYDVTMQEDKKILRDSYRLEHNTFKDENPELTFTRFIWDPYNRVEICTDQTILLMVDPKNGVLDHTLNTSSRPISCILTQKHLIVSLEDGTIVWHAVEPPDQLVGEQDEETLHNQKMRILDDIEQDFTLNIKVGESDVPEYISYMHYSKTYETLIMGTETGVFGILNVQAEAINYDEDEDEQNKKKERKTITEPFIELGRFHTKNVNGIRELGESTQIVTISDDHYMSVWEATNQKLLSTVYQPAIPTALEVTKDGNTSFIGTVIGACRAYDLQDRLKPRLVMQQKFFEESIPISCIKASQDGKYILFSSVESCNVFILSASAMDGFQVLAFIQFNAKVCSASFLAIDGVMKVVTVLSNNLIGAATVPTKAASNRMIPMPAEEANILYRKIDKGSNLIITNEVTGDIFVSGDDRLLKKYDFPTEKIEQIDIKRAPPAPIEEHTSHPIGTTTWDVSKEFKFMATGGKDGSIFLRHINNIGQQPQPIKGHAMFSGGVGALCFSQSRSIIYTAGGDGAIMAWNFGGKPNPSDPITFPSGSNTALTNLPELARVPGHQIKLYKQILREEFERREANAKLEFKDMLVADLSKIKDKLLALLAENERVTDIERLERDDFIIDVDRKNRVESEGEKECEDIRKEAEKTVLRLELLRDRVKQSTWDTMEVQQKAIKSIQSDTLIFNYPVRNRTATEKRRLNQIIRIRKIELKERYARMEAKLKEGLDEDEFSKFTEEYIMNRTRNNPEYLEDSAILDAAAEFSAKDEMKKAIKKKQGEQNLNVADPSAGQKKMPILKITKGKLGVKTKKKDDDDEGGVDKSKMQQREIKGMEEMHWKVYFKIQELQKASDNLDKENVPIFELLYEPFELFTDVRKRNQIELIKAVVFELKNQHNKEFFDLEKFKEDQGFAIKEKNEQISELLEQLKQTEELFEPKSHPLETPDTILTVDPSEIKVEKYLTKEERAVLEAERKKQEEREAALKGDNVGQRGLKFMMGGTELNLKKDKGALDTELIREDWMNQPFDDMSEEEKTKFKEFEQKEKEFKDKQRKAWEQDLKKIKGEIIEIQLKFEESLLTLFKKKLFIDVRVLEQELYLIRLVIMLHDAKETRLDEKKYREEMIRLEAEKASKEDMINYFKEFSQDLDLRLQEDQSLREQDKEIKRLFPDANYKQIMAFVRQGKSKKPTIPGEVNVREQELVKNIIELDPFSGIDKAGIKEILKEEDERENYTRADKIGELNDEDWEKLVNQRQIRVLMDKDKTSLQNKIKQVQEHMNYLEAQYNDIDEQYEAQTVAQKKAAQRIEKIRFNFEVIVYLKQGWVEVPQLPVATDYKDAILVSEDVIEMENHEIKNKGDKKVKLMNKISKFKTDLKRVRYVKKRLDLEITDFEERAKDVQLYRVTKQTQEIIQGKHQKKDEEDKKRLENQIKQLEENANKRIKTINETKQKLKREIREKRMESEQLETKARQLQNNVDQRKQIMSLKSNTMNDGDADPSKKIKEIAHKRKLLDIAKQQTEEIEVLRDELDRLRARTFPSFAHLHNKPGYPDEN